MPSFEPEPPPLRSRSASVKTACLVIHVLPVPGPARTSVGCAECIPFDRCGDGTSINVTRSRTSSTFHSAGTLTLSCTSVAVDTCKVWSLMRSMLPVIASSTIASRSTMSSQ